MPNTLNILSPNEVKTLGGVNPYAPSNSSNKNSSILSPDEVKSLGGINPYSQTSDTPLSSIISDETPSFNASMGGVETILPNIAKTFGNIPSNVNSLANELVKQPIQNIKNSAIDVANIYKDRGFIQGTKDIGAGFADVGTKIFKAPGEFIVGQNEKADLQKNLSPIQEQNLQQRDEIMAKLDEAHKVGKDTSHLIQALKWNQENKQALDSQISTKEERNLGNINTLTNIAKYPIERPLDIPLAFATDNDVTKGRDLISSASKPVKQGVEKSLATFKESFLTKTPEKAFQKTLDIVKQPLSESEQTFAIAQGKGSTKGILGNIKIEPSAQDKKIAEVAHGFVKGKPFQDIKSLQNEIDNSMQKVREGISNSKAIWNKNNLVGKLNSIEKPITVKSDRTLNNVANNFNRALLQLTENTDKKAVGLLDLRQNFDVLVKKELPRLYDREMTPMRQYVRNLRDTLNDYAESTLPDGKLPDGTSYRAELKRQSLLIKAINNIAEKAPKEATNYVTNWVKANPKKTIAITALISSLLGTVGSKTYAALNTKSQ